MPLGSKDANVAWVNTQVERFADEASYMTRKIFSLDLVPGERQDALFFPIGSQGLNSNASRSKHSTEVNDSLGGTIIP